MSRPMTWLGFALLLLLPGPAMAVAGPALEQAQPAPRLQIDSIISPEGTIVPGQKATLSIVIATDRWFSGGTRISLPEVPGLVILQTQQFASNASENRNGQSWVVQRWSLDIYPQRAGDFVIPAMSVRVKVNAGDAGEVASQLRTAPVNFTVVVPQSLEQAEHWVAAPAFDVRQSFDKPLENLQPGDAFEREIVFEASDVMAMMLPSPAVDNIPGLAAYPSPPVLENNSNRGQTTATRIQRTSYVVEAQGNYQLRAQEYFWWDTNAQELRLLSLPPVQVIAGAGMAASTRELFADLPLSPRQLLAAALGSLLLAGLLWVIWRRLPAVPAARVTAALSRLRQQWQALREPALPRQLNPGSNSAD